MEGEGGRGGEWRLGTHSFRSRSPTRFRAFPPRSPLFLCSARLLATPRLVATTPSLFFAPFLYPRLIDAGLENQDGRPITLSISRSPVYLRGNILPKNKYLRRARPLAFRFFIHHPPLHPSRRRMTSLEVVASLDRVILPLRGRIFFQKGNLIFSRSR